MKRPTTHKKIERWVTSSFAVWAILTRMASDPDVVDLTVVKLLCCCSNASETAEDKKSAAPIGTPNLYYSGLYC